MFYQEIKGSPAGHLSTKCNFYHITIWPMSTFSLIRWMRKKELAHWTAFQPVRNLGSNLVMSGFSTLNTTPSFLLGENVTSTHILEDSEPQFFENFHLVHDLVILILCGLGCITNPLIIIILGKQSVGSKFVYFSPISLCSLSSSKRVCEEGVYQIITRVIFALFV